MLSIDQVIQRDPNPFDTETFWSGNFWQEEQNPDLTVESIHADVIQDVETILDRVAADQRTRTVLLDGETGSGKTYLLGRIKRQLNPKAFFVYVEPFTASDYIWRHILRYTVDSLLETPAGYKESQILLWLQGMKAFQQRSMLDRLRGERQVFIRKLLESYPSGIYNAQEFFGVLYSLTDKRTYAEACEWLRGDDLDDETLRRLGVRSCIDTEEAARMMLANFGRISEETQPIVLCFDQLDNIARNRDGQLDIETLFRVNAMVHTQKLKNFLIVISIITDTWRQNCERIPQTDRDRIDHILKLKQIGLEQAEALWASRLYLLHRKARPQPTSPIYPLDRQVLYDKFPGGKTRPRNTLILGRRCFQECKIDLLRADLAERDRNPRLNPAARPAPLRLPEAQTIAFTPTSSATLGETVGKTVGDRGKLTELAALEDVIDAVIEVSDLANFNLMPTPQARASLTGAAIPETQSQERQSTSAPSGVPSSAPSGAPSAITEASTPLTATPGTNAAKTKAETKVPVTSSQVSDQLTPQTSASPIAPEISKARPSAPMSAAADPLAAFKLVWIKKFQQTQKRVEKIRQYATPELIQMLAEALEVLDIQDIKLRMLTSRTYASYSLSYRSPVTGAKMGVVWSEDINLVKLYNVMKACRDALKADRCDVLQLIRAEGLGVSSNRGYKLYAEIFGGNLGEHHQHFTPDLNSVHHLVTYHALVNDALSGELVVGEITPNLVELQTLMRQADLLKNCLLLQQFGFFEMQLRPAVVAETPIMVVTDFVINRVLNQQCMAIEQLVKEVVAQFPDVNEEQAIALVNQLSQQAKHLQILDPSVEFAEQLVYAIDQTE